MTCLVHLSFSVQRKVILQTQGTLLTEASLQEFNWNDTINNPLCGFVLPVHTIVRCEIWQAGFADKRPTQGTTAQRQL